MYSTTIERCFMIEASGMHRWEAFSRQAIGHVPPLACTVGPHGFLKEASTCRIETTLDVSFNEPFGPVPCIMDFCQGRLASPSWSEPVTVLGKLWFIVCLKNGSYYILNHLWRPVWHAQWSFSTFRLVYIDAPCWGPLPPFVAHGFDHSVDLIE